MLAGADVLMMMSSGDCEDITLEQFVELRAVNIAEGNISVDDDDEDASSNRVSTKGSTVAVDFHSMLPEDTLE